MDMRKLATVLMVLAFLLSGREAWAQAAISGTVYEQDSISPIEGAVVTFSGITELSDTLVFQFVTDTLGCYNDSLAAGTYRVWASAEGYETVYLLDSLQVMEGQTLTGIDFVLHEEIYIGFVGSHAACDDYSTGDGMEFTDGESDESARD